MRRRLTGNGERFRNKSRGASYVKTFNLGDELERAAATFAISEAVPGAFLEIDHELPEVAATVNGTAAGELRPDALELGVEAIVSKDACERNKSTKLVEFRAVENELREHRVTPRERLPRTLCEKAWVSIGETERSYGVLTVVVPALP